MDTRLAIAAFFVVVGCCDDNIKVCPCFENDQGPVFKTCVDANTYEEAVNCTGGAIINHLYTHLKYPQEAWENKIGGRVTISFTIFENGEVGDYTIVKDTIGYGLSEAAIEAIETFNVIGFCPARKDCKTVEYNFILPVLFVLPPG